MIETLVTVLFFVGVFVLAEFVRPYRLRLEARLRARERAHYEEMARAEEAKAEAEEITGIRVIYLKCAGKYRELAAKVRP